MSVFAVCLQNLLCRWTYTSQNIFSTRYWFKMIRIHATANTTQMI